MLQFKSYRRMCPVIKVIQLTEDNYLEVMEYFPEMTARLNREGKVEYLTFDGQGEIHFGDYISQRPASNSFSYCGADFFQENYMEVD